MKRLCTILSAALAASILSPLPANAQESAGAQTGQSRQQDAYSRLYDEIVTSVPLEPGVRQLSVVAVDELFATDALLAQISQENRDFRKDMIEVFFPYLLQMSQRVQREYRPVYLDTLERQLSTEEAGMMIEVFSSEVGQKLMGNVSRNFRAERSVREALDEGDVSRESIRADNRETAQRSVSQLSQDDLQQLGEFAQRYPGLLATFQRLNPHLLEIRVRMDNELPTAREERVFIERLEAVYADYGLVLQPQ